MQCILLVYSPSVGPCPYHSKLGDIHKIAVVRDYLQGSRSLMHGTSLNGRNHLGLNCCYHFQKELSCLLLALLLPILGISPMYVTLCILVWLGIAAPVLCKSYMGFLFCSMTWVIQFCTFMEWFLGSEEPVQKTKTNKQANHVKISTWTSVHNKSLLHSSYPKGLDLSGMASLSDFLATPRTSTLKEQNQFSFIRVGAQWSRMALADKHHDFSFLVP